MYTTVTRPSETVKPFVEELDAVTRAHIVRHRQSPFHNMVPKQSRPMSCTTQPGAPSPPPGRATMEAGPLVSRRVNQVPAPRRSARVLCESTAPGSARAPRDSLRPPGPQPQRRPIPVRRCFAIIVAQRRATASCDRHRRRQLGHTPSRPTHQSSIPARTMRPRDPHGRRQVGHIKNRPTGQPYRPAGFPARASERGKPPIAAAPEQSRPGRTTGLLVPHGRRQAGHMPPEPTRQPCSPVEFPARAQHANPKIRR